MTDPLSTNPCWYNQLVIGYDFYVYWQIGRAILQGTDPYLVENAAYSPNLLTNL